MAILNKAIAACSEAIEKQKGKLVVKEAPRAVSSFFYLLVTSSRARFMHPELDAILRISFSCTLQRDIHLL